VTGEANLIFGCCQVQAMACGRKLTLEESFPRLQYIEVLRIQKVCIGCNAAISVTLWLFNSLPWFFDGPFIEIDGLPIRNGGSVHGKL